MLKYRVSLNLEISDVLAMIRNRHNDEVIDPWQKEFDTYEEAEEFSFMISLRTGKQSKIHSIDPYETTKDRIAKLLENEEKMMRRNGIIK